MKMTSKASDRPPHENSSPYKPRPPGVRSPPLAGTRGYPYPQEPGRSSYPQHSTTVTHIPVSVYATPVYRDSPYAGGERGSTEYVIERFRENEAGQVSHQQVRRRPSLLPTPEQAAADRMERERYLEAVHRYAGYEREVVMPTAATVPFSTGTVMLSAGNVNVNATMAAAAAAVQLSAPPSLEAHDVVAKRPRLATAMDQKPPINQQLLIDTRELVEVKKEPAYTPQVEAISPTLPSDDVRHDISPQRTSKDHLLQSINRIDREISQVESQMTKLQKKQQELEAEANKPQNSKSHVTVSSTVEPKQMSIAQIIYSENRKKAYSAHAMLEPYGPKVDIPMYNQPTDTPVYHENKRKFMTFKKRLLAYFKRRQTERITREEYLTETYSKLMQEWSKKMEKRENNATKKAKDQKQREFFEKQFPELKKQREDKERFSRVGQRIRSDAELEEIMDGLQEQELEDKKMRSYAVIPPIMLDPKVRQIQFINRNGLVENPMAEYKERQLLNIWTEQEREIFREKYLQHPKNFCVIASYLERKSVADCVQYYYLTKKRENYKTLLRKHNVKKRTRALVKPNPQNVSVQGGISTRQQEEAKAAAAAAVLSTTSSTATTTSTSTTVTSIATSLSSSTASSSSTVVSTTSVTTSSTMTLVSTPATSSIATVSIITTTTSTPAVTTSASISSSVGAFNNTSTTVSTCSSSSVVSSAITPSNVAVASTSNPDLAQKMEEAGKNLSNDAQRLITERSNASGCAKRTNQDGEEAGDEMSDNDASENRNEAGGVHPCVVCKVELENFNQSRPLKRYNCDLYGLKESDYTSDMRVCSSCRFKFVRRKCPIPTCKTPKRKVKRLRPLPAKLAEPSEMRDAVMVELKIPPDVTKCCSTCFNRIARKLGANTLSENEDPTNDLSSWTEEMIESIKKGIKENGTKWVLVCECVVGKTKEQCKKFYFNYKRKFGLETVYREFQESQRAKGIILDGTEDDSGETTSSCEEDNCVDQNSSDTASAPSPSNARVPKNMEKKGINDTLELIRRDAEFPIEKTAIKSGGMPFPHQEPKNFAVSTHGLTGPSAVVNTGGDHDSSATVSADEGQGGPGEIDGRVTPSRIITLSPGPPSSVVNLQHSKQELLTASRMVEPYSIMVPRTEMTMMPVKKMMLHHDHAMPGAIRPEMLPVSQQHPPNNKQPKEEPTYVRDLIYHAIEVSLQMPVKPGRNNTPAPPPIIPNMAPLKDLPTRERIEAKRTNDGPPSAHGVPPPLPPPRRPIYNPSPSVTPPISRPEGLAVMASYSHLAREREMDQLEYEVQDLSKKDKVKDYPANSSPSNSMKKDKLRLDQHGYVTSQPPQHPYQPINLPPPAHSNQLSRTTQPPLPELAPHYAPADHRRETFYQIPQTSEQRVVAKTNYLVERSQPPHLVSQNMISVPPSVTPPGRHVSKININKSSVPPPPPLIASNKPHAMSPKIVYKDKHSTPSHIGSITEGTPVNKLNPQAGIPPSSPRFEGLLRPIPPTPHGKEGGSIMLGTPVQHDLPKKQITINSNGKSEVINVMELRGGSLPEGLPRPGLPAVYDAAAMEQYYRRMSPTLYPGYQPPSNFAGSGPPPPPPPRAPYASESALSSKQIMIDFNTSKQMQMRRGSASSDKDTRASPRPDSNPHASLPPPASQSDSRLYAVYQGGNQPSYQGQNSAGAYIPMSDGRFPHHPTSPALISANEARGTPPESQMSPGAHWAQSKHNQVAPRQNVIQQNVIQRSITWGTGKPSVIQAPKSVSPRAVELRVESISPAPINKGSPSPRFTHPSLPTGHDAFNALVNAAAAQPSLVVPKEDRRVTPNPVRNEVVQSPRDGPSAAEGLEKSLLEMHQRPRSHSETGLHTVHDRYREMERGRASVDNIPIDGDHHPQMMIVPPALVEEQRYLADQHHRRSVESERDRVTTIDTKLNPDAERLRFVPEHSPSLRFSGVREPFSKEQFEREMRQEHPSRSSREPPRDYPKTNKDEPRLKQNEGVEQGSQPQSSGHRSELDEASKIFSHSFQKDSPKQNPPREFTAANLIDAIITHQINQNTEAPAAISKNPAVDNIFRYRANEAHERNARPKNNSREEIVTIDDGPNERERPPYNRIENSVRTPPSSSSAQEPHVKFQHPEKSSITLGEHIAAIISKNYNGPNDMQQHVQNIYEQNRINAENPGGPLPLTKSQQSYMNLPPALQQQHAMHVEQIKARERERELQREAHLRDRERELHNRERELHQREQREQQQREIQQREREIQHREREAQQQRDQQVQREYLQQREALQREMQHREQQREHHIREQQHLQQQQREREQQQREHQHREHQQREQQQRDIQRENQERVAHHREQERLHIQREQMHREQLHREHQANTHHQQQQQIHVQQRSRPLEGIAATAVGSLPPEINHTPSEQEQHHSWKLRRALQQEKERSPSEDNQHMQAPSPAVTHDERQIIRIAQAGSPGMRSTRSSPHTPTLTPYAIEPISPPIQSIPDSNGPVERMPLHPLTPPTSNTTSGNRSNPPWTSGPSIAGLLTSRRMYQIQQENLQSGNASQQMGLSPLDYVKNRIVEVMRTAENTESDPRSQPSPVCQQSPMEEREAIQRQQQHYVAQHMNDSEAAYSERPQSAGSSRSTPKESSVVQMAHRYSPGPGGGNPNYPHSLPPPSNLERTPSRGSAMENMRAYKRSHEIISGSAEWAETSSNQPSASPSSSDHINEPDPKKRRTEGQYLPESSTDRRNVLYTESSDNHSQPRINHSASSSHGECFVSGSRMNSQVSSHGGSKRPLASPASRSSPTESYNPQSSRHENESVDVESSNMNQNQWKVSSNDDRQSVHDVSVDSPASGEMVIDESSNINVTPTSSRIEPVSPPSQEISTSDNQSLAGGSVIPSSSGPNQPTTTVSGSSYAAYGRTSISSSNVSSSSPQYSSAPVSVSQMVTSSQPLTSGAFPPFSGVGNTYAYPFSALTMRSLSSSANQPNSTMQGQSSSVSSQNSSNLHNSAVSVGAPSSQTNNPQQQQPQQPQGSNSNSNSPTSGSRENHPAPLLSAHYEPLSDED